MAVEGGDGGRAAIDGLVRMPETPHGGDIARRMGTVGPLREGSPRPDLRPLFPLCRFGRLCRVRHSARPVALARLTHGTESRNVTLS
jgi:hypothetical protein